ncbi:uncharacterized protein LACBIDRAFT_297043 [Laccaria bicolor S238N-H82]|uniref:Predicted protein n=1 Tax=Laccaria bicolor (strain S238N-H82 / ATCC MYA-4686) TaxID=486041 RepID=B0D9V3_LACBS|nr:uncharacterized protein LACBIDRAFT_297043 [Laccaria bicolor S238N-H82]EDR08412.1 predicted protein [Laccaria bicolor S238N-H82]|eukprot:XP_001880637.1 predicted protein [Laccaria bicolor S238N-H82]
MLLYTNNILSSQFPNLIFNMCLPSSGQVKLPAAFVKKILSSRRSNGSLKRSQPDRSGDVSVIGTEEPSLQTRTKRQKQAPPLHEELDTFPSSDSASPALLLDLPNELLQLILCNLTDSDLLSPALLFNRRLRANAAHTYLARTGIIEHHNGYIYIRDVVGRTAIVLLSTTPLFDKISLTCDLFYVVEYGRHLRKLIAATPRVRSVCIEFDEREMELLHDTRILEPLIAFLASLRDTCFSLQLQRSRSYFTPPTRSLTIPLHRPTRPVRQLPTWGLLKGISSLAVSADLTRIPSLLELCRSIFVIASSHIEDFQLEDCSLQQDCDSILSLINFPKLRTFSIRSLSHVTISIKVAFFKQHSLVKTVFLFSNPLNGLTPTAPKSALSLPPLTHLFLSANYRLLKEVLSVPPLFLQESGHSGGFQWNGI